MCGKLIVATNLNQVDALSSIKSQGERNGVTNLLILDSQTVKSYFEPEVSCVQGLLSPSTGILDSHMYMECLKSDIDAADGNVVFDCKVETIKIQRNKSLQFIVDTSQGSIECDYLGNNHISFVIRV